jgi:hypothetical protein
MSYTCLNECVFGTLGDFLQIEKWGILRSNVFTSNSVSNWENFYGDFSDVATGLWRGLFELYAVSWVVLYQHFKSGRTSIKDDPKSVRPSTSMDNDHIEKVLAMIRQKHPRGETVNKEFYLNVLKRLRVVLRNCEGRGLRCGRCTMTMHLLMCHSLSMNFFTKYEMTVVP